MNDIIESARDGRVLHIALNRPEKRNALNAELCLALAHAMEDADGDADIGAILLTANGKTFCAGMDMNEATTGTAPATDAAQEQIFTIGARINKPIVASVQGAALGGGMGLVANCHIVVATEDATFGLTEIRLGLWPFLVYRAVSTALGDRRTLELALTGRIFTAREAKEFGLVHEISGRAAEIAKSLAAQSQPAIRAGLRYVRDSRGKDLETAGEIARRMRQEVFASQEFRDAVRAFQQRGK